MRVVVRWAVIVKVFEQVCAGQRSGTTAAREGKMNNDFTGNELHKARHYDLMKEAEGGRRLKMAGGDKPGQPIGMLVLKAVGVLGAVLLIAQVFAQ
jgi:hypothetical protein